LSSSNLRFAIFQLPFRGRDEFLPLKGDPIAECAWVRPQDYKGGAKVIILPGSARSGDDLACLRAEGGDRLIREHLSQGGRLVLVCGGLQIAGEWLNDPTCKQGSQPKVEGLGLLPISTWFGPKMLNCESKMELLVGCGAGGVDQGVEHRSGYTELVPFAKGVSHLHRVVARKHTTEPPQATTLADGQLWQPGTEQFDGLVTDDRQIWATYLHLIFHNEAFKRSFFATLG
jgi:adenosylcobyric acid synthase